MDPVVLFELPAKDNAKMIDFYSKAFGWKMHQFGPEMGDYVTIQTGEVDEKNMLKEPGRINGGFYKPDEEHHVPTVVIAVDDIKEASRKVTEAGGQVLGGHLKNGEPDDIPNVGLYSAIIDPEGNRIALLQPKTM